MNVMVLNLNVLETWFKKWFNMTNGSKNGNWKLNENVT